MRVMAYVPPALRVGQESMKLVNDRQSTANTYSTRPTVNDIQKHFWPRQELTQQLADEDEDEKGESVPSSHYHPHSTLNATQEHPNFLRYVLLFADANPQWRTQQRIYAKTNLHLLPTDQAQVDQPSSPIMVFIQNKSRGSRFDFLGYHKLTSVQFYEPHTLELAQMLGRKFTNPSFGGQKRTKRDAQAWKSSLGMRWAELQLKRDPKANSFIKPPNIAATPLPPKPPQVRHENKGKSVNELLAEMRLDRPISEDIPSPATFSPEVFTDNIKRTYDFDYPDSDSRIAQEEASDKIELPAPPKVVANRPRSFSDTHLTPSLPVWDQTPRS